MEEVGYVSEIFCSIQGEGLHVGERQVFLRTAGCSENCVYCDTVFSRDQSRDCVVYGRGERYIANPISVKRVSEEIRSLLELAGPVRALSITGGEPLEQWEFVVAAAKDLGGRGLRIFLETNGLHVSPLRRILAYVDVVAMDIKLPSATGRERWSDHRAFLELAKASEVYVKIVIGTSTGEDEFSEAVGIVSGVCKSIPLVLQPDGRTFFSGENRGIERIAAKLFEYQKIALRELEDVRIIPQYHKVLGIR